MHRCLSIAFLVLLSLAERALAEDVDLSSYRDASFKKWEKDMGAFDLRNTKEKHPPEAVFFCGSSSIRKWDQLAADVAPYHPIHRGFGGSQWSDLAVHADRLIAPHQFRAAVFFVANDIKGEAGDKSPEEVLALVKYVRAKVRAHQPEAVVLLLPTTPTPKRWKAWPEISRANALIQEWCIDEADTYYLDTTGAFLGRNGRPRRELFVSDQLHLNKAGYALWSEFVTGALNLVLKEP